MKKVMKDIFLKLIFNIKKIYMTLKKSKGLLLIYMIKLNMFSYKKPKASFTPWTSLKKGTQSD